MTSKGEFTGYGFAAGDVRGTRAWKVDRLGRLTGVTYPQVWRPGENLAECKRTRPKARASGVDPHMGEPRCSCGERGCRKYERSLSLTHMQTYTYSLFDAFNQSEPNPCFLRGVTAMDPDCKCGFYAYQEGSNDYYKPGGDAPVGGVVQGYGNTVLGSRGFRSEKARILALFVESGDTKRAATKLRLEALYTGVPIYTDYEQMLRDFPPTPPEGYGSPADEGFWDREAL